MAREPGKAADAKPLTKEERQARREKRLASGKPVGAPGKKGGAGKAAGRAKNAGSGGRETVRERRSGGVLGGRGAAPDRSIAARKVMVISFQKTGTTTLTDVLRSLGLSVAHVTQTINSKLKGQSLSGEETDATVRAMAFEAADRADAVQDSPYPLLFKELDTRYPGSKFIYLDRDPDSWVKSVVGHFGTGSTALRDWIYGEPKAVGNEEVYRKRFLEHRDEVRAYFADRPGDILYVNLAEGDGWLKLVNFLGEDFLPPFPHRNKRS